MSFTLDFPGFVNFVLPFNDLQAAVTFWYQFNVGDKVVFTYNGVHCRGEIIQIFEDPTNTMGNDTYQIAIYACADWTQFSDTRVIVPNNVLTLVTTDD